MLKEFDLTRDAAYLVVRISDVINSETIFSPDIFVYLKHHLLIVCGGALVLVIHYD